MNDDTRLLLLKYVPKQIEEFRSLTNAQKADVCDQLLAIDPADIALLTNSTDADLQGNWNDPLLSA